MSEKRLAIYVAFLNDIKHLSDDDFEEVLDNLFCIHLAERYDRYADKDDLGTPIDVLAENLGIDLGDNDK